MKLLIAFSLLILSNFSNLNLAFERIDGELIIEQQQQRRQHQQQQQQQQQQQYQPLINQSAQQQQQQLQQMIRSVNPSARRPPADQFQSPETNENNAQAAQSQNSFLINLLRQSAMLRSQPQQRLAQQSRAFGGAEANHMIQAQDGPPATSRPLNWLVVDKRSDIHHQQQQLAENNNNNNNYNELQQAGYANHGLTREEVIQIFLEEMAKHNFELPNSGRAAAGDNNNSNNNRPLPLTDDSNLSDAILSQLSRAPANNEQLQMGITNRLRGRSAAFLRAASGPMGLQEPALSGFRADGGGGAAGGLPKRTTNGHIPCYFNAITCF